MQGFVQVALVLGIAAEAAMLPRSASPPGGCDDVRVREVVGVLSSIQAASFCQTLIGVKTATAAVTATETSVVTVVSTDTSLVPQPVTASSTTIVTETILTTVTDVVSSTPPAVTETATATATELETVTVSATVTTTINSGINVMRRAAAPSRAAKAPGCARPDVPAELKGFSLPLIRAACECYVVRPTITQTVSITVTDTTTSAALETSTATTTVTTIVLTSSTPVTATVSEVTTTLLPAQTEAATVTVTTTETATTTTQLMAATDVSRAYTQKQSGNGCVYNRYTNYDEIPGPKSRGFFYALQFCAARCNLNAACAMFFVYEDKDYDNFWCIRDDTPYSTEYLQCNIPFSGQTKAFDKNQA
ncbi:hypothetical protein Micbo1qcDRAFT_237283 [Microdochium bolleyi]|uniref:Apple domain-containing protein n=1 Tax=Microdochium bolleyi TaxID=196109 RepID=A0A136ILR2_9PEZI|nr:hypothetical protein Micbo1qcDRAFT_237283 [Microdochium bolleyi]